MQKDMGALTGSRPSDEEWRDIPGYEGLYEVSNHGRVLSRQLGSPKMLVPAYDRDGYPFVKVTKGRERKHLRLHRVVCLVFNGAPLPGLEVGHLDGNRNNPHASNLEWVTRKQNLQHKTIHGTAQIGEQHPLARLTVANVLEIKKRLARGDRQTALGREFGVSPSAIRDIATGKNWAHVSAVHESGCAQGDRP